MCNIQSKVMLIKLIFPTLLHSFRTLQILAEIRGVIVGYFIKRAVIEMFGSTEMWTARTAVSIWCL